MQMTRRKRFERKPVKGFRETDDDYEVLKSVYHLRLANTDHIHALMPHRSRQKLGRRITTLFDVGWLDKPKAQVALFPETGGSNHHVVALANDGAKVLSEKLKLSLPATRWTQRNKELRSTSIPHILDTTEFAVRVVGSARRHEGRVAVEYAHDILGSLKDPPVRKSKPLSFKVPVRWHDRASTRGIEPDDLLRITFESRDQASRNMIEIDNGTETIEPSEDVQTTESFWRSSSILKKYVLYASAFKHRACKPFEFDAFRVLMVTKSSSRMSSMQACEAKYLNNGTLRMPPGFVLYTTWEHINEHDGDVLSMPWQNRLGKPVYLDGVKR